MSVTDELHRLAELHQRGALSDDEFARAKARVLDAAPGAHVHPSPSQAINSFRRSADDRWVGGVCGGISRSTGIASWAWRLAFILGMAFAGCGVLLYVLLWILVPNEPLYLPAPADRLNAG